MTITCHHNPACGTSRNALAILQAGGDAVGGVAIVEYLRDPPARDRLAALYRAAGITPRDGMRTKGNEALIAGSGLADPGPDDERVLDARVLDAMMAHPILINRPLVETPLGALLARPSERVADVLRDPPASSTKADGEVVRLR